MKLFVDFCLENYLVIGESLFIYKVKHKATWISPDHITKNQTDHVAISRRHGRSLLHVQSKESS